MQSRMDKYSYNREQEEARSNKNKNLYSEVYNADFYTEITDLENTNEVDLSKIKELLKNREEYQKAKNYRDILGTKEEEVIPDSMPVIEEEKVYDVNSILEKAKEERRETENYKKATTEYDILKKLNLLSIEEKANDMLQSNKREEEKLRELIDTITMKKEEILDADNSGELDFLEELRGETTVLKGNETYLKGDTTIIDDEIIKTKETLIGELVVSAPKKDKKGNTKNFENKIDRSFFTSSLSLSKNDFEDLKDLDKHGKHSIVVKILLFILVAIALAIGFYVFNTYINV
ncbi:MAG: hypothetical protein PHS45_04220 [Bacilli bacterium]|nr:hypothetical protein [Bacilli bacterium]